MNKALLSFTLRRNLKSPVLFVFLAVLLLLPPYLYRAGNKVREPAAGYILAKEADNDAARIASYLNEAGLTAYPDEAALKSALAEGQIEAGVMIPADVTAALQSGSYQGLLGFIASPDALYPELWREHAVSALFAVYAPYISADILAESGIDPALVLAEYDRLISSGGLFHFTLKTAQGAALEEEGRGKRLFTGALAILLYLASYFACARPLWESGKELALRIGQKKAFLLLYLPGLILRFLLLLFFSAGACLLTGLSEMLPALAVYLLLLSVLHSVLLLLPLGRCRDILVFFVSIAALAACPIYFDLSLMIPALSSLRLMLPPYWLWLFL